MLFLKILLRQKKHLVVFPVLKSGILELQQAIFYQAVFQLGDPQRILVHGVVLPPVQDFGLLLDELHEVPVSPFVQPAKVSLGESTTCWCITHTSQSCAMNKLAEGTLCRIIQTIDENVKQDWPQH